ncbi:DUF5996 family protein [Nitrosomonas communis]|uniref:DUF5996 family protein n=1 Tax=Nitrosomonas communis TaxID=44574 RepID=UPI0026EDEC2E|nr:DUF5996 family protein [Nitrosomonas communis]MCO6427064.1 hypothetical protein [Nitrosomonas communis]
MSNLTALNYDPWPAFSAEEFMPTSHLFHMCVQAIGKLMLTQPFEPHWANLAMPLTSRGVTTGIIPYDSGTFSVEIDCIDHIIVFTSSWGGTSTLKLGSMSIAHLTRQIFQHLENMGITIKINHKPQEVSDPIPFDQDTALRIYDEKVINAWWRIMLSTYRVLLKFHAKFYGITPRIGLFWGTLDLRDARYKGVHLPTANMPSDFISRNAMDDAQFEVGFSASNEKYPTPSFFAFAYPKPDELERAIIKPAAAKWISVINEFILDYDDLRKSKDPDGDLLMFFESNYQAFAKLAGWDPEWIVSSKPI